jgi:hypothetical protein
VSVRVKQTKQVSARPLSDDVLALKHAIAANTEFWLQQRDKPRFSVSRPTNGPEQANHDGDKYGESVPSPRLEICRCRLLFGLLLCRRGHSRA